MRQGSSKPGAAIAAMIPAALLLASFAAHGQGTGAPASVPALSGGYRFRETGGEELFVNACQGCHMADGKGAAGAGIYSSLAGNSHLEAAFYPVEIVVHGQRGMPALGAMMSDDQVAAVVNYLRSHFGNSYRDAVTAEDVRTVRR